MVHHACPKVPGLGPGLPCIACAMLCTGHGCSVQMPELCRDAWHCHAHGSTKPCLRRAPTAQRLSPCRTWGAAQTATCQTAWRTWRRRPALRARCRASAVPASFYCVVAVAYVRCLHARTPDSNICASAFHRAFLARCLCLCLSYIHISSCDFLYLEELRASSSDPLTACWAIVVGGCRLAAKSRALQLASSRELQANVGLH